MSKIIVYVEGTQPTGYEVVEPNMIEAARCGLFGADAVAFDRIAKAQGIEAVQIITKNAAKKTADEALADIATSRGKAFVLADRVPDGEPATWAVAGGKVVLKAAG